MCNSVSTDKQAKADVSAAAREARLQAKAEAAAVATPIALPAVKVPLPRAVDTAGDNDDEWSD
jgi:hypothetical protein